MSHRTSKETRTAIELTGLELEAVSGGLNPQPLPPGFRLEPQPVPWMVAYNPISAT